MTSTKFGQIFQEYKPQFVMVARSYVRDMEVAEDLVMDSFISYWENRHKIDITQSIPSYILVSIKNRCLNWLRDQSTHLKTQEEIHSSQLRIISSRIASIETNNPNSLFLEEISNIIKEELDKMPDQTRNVFLANRFDNLTYKEIGDKFGLSFNQVSFEIRKATQVLRVSLKDYLPFIIISGITNIISE